MDGPLALGWADMAAWASLTSTAVHPAEWRILRAMDQAYLAAGYEMVERDRAQTANPHTVSEQPMTADLFDAIFQ